jgi:prolyl oligopeptidase
MVTTGGRDERSDTFHALKFVARLQAATVPGRPVLLRYDAGADHGGAGLPRSRRIEEATDEQGFLFWQVGLTAFQPSALRNGPAAR